LVDPAETARVLRYLADESAGQCGPCVHGLAAIAGAFASLAAGTGRRGTVSRLERWCGQVDGRGACHHPNGAVRFLRSALRVFAEEIDDHRRHGRCDDCGHPPVLHVPDGWRAAA
jgi:NADH:ubiquinone oxidoreductase subunit F (NADH-binding)